MKFAFFIFADYNVCIFSIFLFAFVLVLVFSDVFGL